MKNDIDIQHSVQYELEWEPSVDAAHIGVTAKDGVVTLSGHVTSHAEKLTAERATKNVYGVRAVANELTVRVPGSHKRSDADIAGACADALKFHSSVPAGRIKPTVEHGRITLEGEVEWHFQKVAAEAAVRFLPGVVAVINAITIKPRVSAIDVKDKIEQALKRSAELDARRIDVRVDGSKVLLTGTVRSWIEKDEANRTAWAAPGVSQVDDRIAISI